MNKMKEIFLKFKKIKHFYIYLAVIVGLLLCVVYFSSFGKSKTDKSEENSAQENTSAVEYVDRLENKLCNVISDIDGVGKVEVAIALESGFSYEYATDSETKTTISGDVKTTITTETVILVSNEPLVIKEKYPVVKGVVVVAEGADNIGVKLAILTAVQTILNVDSNQISILT